MQYYIKQMGKDLELTEKEKEYIEIRKNCIDKYKKLYKDNLVFDLCKVDKATRIKLLEDNIYIMETKAIKAGLFENQIDTIDNVIAGVYTTEPSKDSSQVVLKAMEMKQKLLLDDIGINDDIKNALNVIYTSMDKEEFNSLGTIEIEEGSGNTDLSADFGMTSDDQLSAEEKAKKLLRQKQSEEKNKLRLEKEQKD